jgi:hypothetical protein
MLQKYLRRLRVLEQTISCKEQENAIDVPHWKWLRNVIENLGEDGMSSEESDHGATEMTYRPTKMEWRRKIDHELQLIDNEYRRLRITQPQRGAIPAIRERGSGVVSSRGPVTGLSMAFYDETWLLSKSDEYISRTLKVSGDTFKWKDIMIR